VRSARFIEFAECTVFVTASRLFLHLHRSLYEKGGTSFGCLRQTRTVLVVVVPQNNSPSADMGLTMTRLQPRIDDQRTDLTLAMALSSIPPQDKQTSQLRIPLTPNEDVLVQTYVPSVDSVIYQEVTGLVSCHLDELAQRLPAYSWAQVFAAVDRLTRQGMLRLSCTSRFDYVLSVCSDPPLPCLRETGEARRCVDGTADSIFGGT
jgi:hypothetical protein